MSVRTSLKNRFSLNEWAGSLGDLGISIPIAYALHIQLGFPLERILFLWGIIYLTTGWYYRLPIAVQPLKAMSVIAIANEISPEVLGVAGIMYGIIFLIIARSGFLDVVQRFFTAPVVRGLQASVGSLLVIQAVRLTMENDFLFGRGVIPIEWQLTLMGLSVVLILILHFKTKLPAIWAIVGLSAVAAALFGAWIPSEQWIGSLPLQIPQFKLDTVFLVLTVLVLPQLPLTIGNAVFAASDACRLSWGSSAAHATPKQLATSIGWSNVFVGLMGGFPVCHGAGGILAHKMFGASTGGATILTGLFMVIVALVLPLKNLILSIPVPVLGALLLMEGMRMVKLMSSLKFGTTWVVGVLMVIVGLSTRNLLLALCIGLLTEAIRSRLEWRVQHG